MTPKEKAEELVYKYRDRFYFLLTDDAIKDCALIAVDEIIEALECHTWQNKVIIKHYEEVKNEIEKL